MTPPLSSLPPPVLDVDVVLFPAAVSITLSRTHSPNVQPESARPLEPKRVSSTDCLNAQDVVEEPFAGASQEMSNAPARVLIVTVRFVVCGELS